MRIHDEHSELFNYISDRILQAVYTKKFLSQKNFSKLGDKIFSGLLVVVLPFLENCDGNYIYLADGSCFVNT